MQPRTKVTLNGKVIGTVTKIWIDKTFLAFKNECPKCGKVCDNCMLEENGGVCPECNWSVS